MGGELVEEVAPDGSVLRTVTRARMRAEGLRHRCTYIAVRSPAGALLVHRRATWKDVWPGRWDLAFGGVCSPGEGWEASARRELAEEAGITAELVDLGPVAFEGAAVKVVGRAFQATSEGPFRFADGEVEEVAWVPLDELPAWLAAHEVCDDTRALIPPLLR